MSILQTNTVVGVAILFTMLGCRTAEMPARVIPTPTASTQPAVADLDVDEWKIPVRKDDPVQKAMNDTFRKVYGHERERVQESLKTFVILRFSGASLFRGGRIVETVRVIPEDYHSLRLAAHVPFTIVLKLRPLMGKPLDAATKAELAAYSQQIRAAIGSVPKLGLNPVQQQRQIRIHEDALKYLEGALKTDVLDPDAFKRYARSSAVDIEANMREAGAAQVVGLHNQLLKWRHEKLSDGEWQQIRFILRGPQQQRGGYAQTVYLSALMNDVGDGRGFVGESERVIYREDTSLPPPTSQEAARFPWEPDLRLLAAIEMDARASELLFGDPDRLAVDVASEGARAKARELDFSGLRFGKE